MSMIMESILIGVCIGVAILSALMIVLSEVKEMWELNNMPKVETYATVISKRKGKGIQKKMSNYYVEYRTDDGKRFECNVSENIFNNLRTGDMGIISYQGMKYLGFRKGY